MSLTSPVDFALFLDDDSFVSLPNLGWELADVPIALWEHLYLGRLMSTTLDIGITGKMGNFRIVKLFHLILDKKTFYREPKQLI